tara:strand:- start:530 stop:835 length:306 start_codon:yes stop_codon:yes gene_type:complete
LNNINFIATYIFRYPLCSGADIRRALYFSKHGNLNSFSERGWATSYFYGRKNHRGYPTKYWHSPKRGKWLLTEKGFEKIAPELIENIENYHNKCAEIVSMR